MASLPECSEYLTIIDTPALYKSDRLKKGHVVKRGNTILRYAGGYCVVFPFESTQGKCAVRCWHASLEDMQERTMLISEELNKLNLPYFVNFEYEKDGVASSKGVQPIVIMDWVDAKPIKDYIATNIHDKEKIKKLAHDFYQMTEVFHRNNISHGDLQHGNIMVRDNGDIVLVDYDSMFVPALKGYKEEIKGLEGYQSEARWNNEKLTPKADYFSEMVIYTSLIGIVVKPEIWEELKIKDSETLIFSADDIKSKGHSEIFKSLEAFDDLEPCIKCMREAMEKTDINDIRPLSEYLHPNENLRKQWDDNGYRPRTNDHAGEVNGLSVAWKDNGYKPQTSVEKTKVIKDIRQEW